MHSTFKLKHCLEVKFSVSISVSEENSRSQFKSNQCNGSAIFIVTVWGLDTNVPNHVPETKIFAGRKEGWVLLAYSLY